MTMTTDPLDDREARLARKAVIARALTELQLMGLPRDYILKREDYINGVTVEQVNAAAKKLLSVSPAIMALGPDGAFAGLK